MPLVKEQNADLVQHEAIVLDLGDLRKQAEQIRDRARRQAGQILVEARQEAERLTAEARESGRQEGLEAGRAQGEQAGREAGHAQALQQSAEDLSKLQQGWTAALERFDAERSQMMLEARQSMLELAIALAGKIVKRVPEVDPTVVHDQLAAAIEQMARPADVTVHIHPDDRPVVEQAMPELTARFGDLQHVTWSTDASIDRGGCRITYGKACIDATLDRQLQRITESLLPATTAAAAEAADDAGDTGEAAGGTRGGASGSRDDSPEGEG
jgi:flagellar assembly protein FliH